MTKTKPHRAAYNTGYKHGINALPPCPPTDAELASYYSLGYAEGSPKRLVPTYVMTSTGQKRIMASIERAAFYAVTQPSTVASTTNTVRVAGRGAPKEHALPKGYVGDALSEFMTTPPTSDRERGYLACLLDMASKISLPVNPDTLAVLEAMVRPQPKQPTKTRAAKKEQA